MTMRACVLHAVRCCPRCRSSRISQKSAVSPATKRQQVRHRLDDREPVARTIRSIFTATDATEANEKLKRAVKHWQSVHPMLAKWAEQNLPEGFTVFGLPELHRVRMRTTNGLERLNKEIKRRMRVACLFPNPESCLRLVSALLCEQDEDWASGKIYLTMKPENTTK